MCTCYNVSPVNMNAFNCRSSLLSYGISRQIVNLWQHSSSNNLWYQQSCYIFYDNIFHQLSGGICRCVVIVFIITHFISILCIRITTSHNRTWATLSLRSIFRCSIYCFENDIISYWVKTSYLDEISHIISSNCLIVGKAALIVFNNDRMSIRDGK